MRADLGAGYPATKALATSRACWRVMAYDWGGAPNPIDVTQYVTGLSVSSSLRDSGQGASISLSNAGGEFEPVAGTLHHLVLAGLAKYTIEVGDLDQYGVATYHDLFVGWVAEGGAHWDAASQTVTLQLGVRDRDVLNQQITSSQYGDPLAGVPVYWDVNDIITDLFVKYGGLADPADFDLGACVFTLCGYQAENQGLMTAGLDLLRPKNMRLWFDYDGHLTSGPLVPAAWGSLLTIPSDVIDSIEGPVSRRPDATRVLVTGAPIPVVYAIIGEAILLGRGYYAYDHPSGNRVRDGLDAIRVSYPSDYSAMYVMGGPQGQMFRYACCELRNIVFGVGGLGDFAVSTPHIEPLTDLWNATTEQHEVTVHWDTGVNDALWIDFTFEVWGYPAALVTTPPDTQAWDDALITAFGDLKSSIQCKAAMTYPDVDAIAQTEKLFFQKSTLQADVTLRHVDLRMEPGDVVTVTRRDGGTYVLWIQSITFSMDPGSHQTQFSGFVL